MWARALCAQQVVKTGDREPVHEHSASRNRVLGIVAEPSSRTLDAAAKVAGRHGEPRGEFVRKLSGEVVNSQVTAWASTFCNSVAVLACARAVSSVLAAFVRVPPRTVTKRRKP
jgi:hypothetical protein